MTSPTSLASRTGGPPLLPTFLPAGGPTGAPGGTGRTSGPAGSGASPVLAARTAKAGKAASARTGSAAARKTTTKKAAGKGGATKTGYATTALPAEYAFLRDPKLSLEEKLSRFIGLVMAKAENDLLAQMEKMAPGSTSQGAGAGTTKSTPGKGGTTSAGATGATAPKKKKGFGLWSAVKVMLPAVGMAASVLGEAATKKLVQQLSGPVLAGAATALGMPQLAPLALQAGKALGSVVTDDEKGAGAAAVALGGLAAGALVGAMDGGGAAVTKVGGSGSAVAKVATGAVSAAGSGTGGTASARSAGGTAPRSEMADQLELQRLMERQKETFSILSNILRLNHEARMTSIQNIR